MKTLILFLLFTSFTFAQEFTVIQINAKWNEKNKFDLPSNIDGAKVVYIYLEDQKENLQKQIKSVPVILVYKDTQAIGQFTAGIDLKLKITIEDIRAIIRHNK